MRDTTLIILILGLILACEISLYLFHEAMVN